MYFDKHPGYLEKSELIRPYSKSQYQHVLSQIDTKVLQQIYTGVAGDEAVNDTKIVDSSGFSIARYGDLYNAKYGKLSVKDFAKLHAIRPPSRQDMCRNGHAQRSQRLTVHEKNDQSDTKRFR